MSNLNVLTARTGKTEELTDEQLREALAEAYPGYRIANIEDLGDEWEATLEKPLDKISSRVRTAEFPIKDEKEEVEEESEEKEEKEEPEESEEKPEKEEGDEDKDSEFPDEEHHEPKKDIKSLVKEILDIVKKLEDKAGLVDEFHEKSKPHIEEAGPSLDEMGPTAPGGGNPAGLSGGGPGGMMDEGPPKRPPVPRRPNVPSGRPDRRLRNPAQRGMPSAFGKIVFSPMSENGKEWSLDEVVAAIQEEYPQYRIASVHEDIKNGRFVGKLTLK